MTPPTRHSTTFIIVVLALVLVDCESNDTPSLGDWTLQTDKLTLTETLRVSETENYFFGSIQDLDATSTGRMVVLDADASHLKVLRPDGALVDTLGRQGKGPGEFQGPTSVDVARGDSVYVFDNKPDRLTVFSLPLSSEPARSAVVTSNVGNLSDVRVLGTRLIGEVTPGYTRKEGLYRPSPNTWYAFDGANALGDPLLRVRRRKVATSFSGPGAAIDYLPFGRVTRVAAGPDGRLYHGFTDSLQLRATSPDGDTESIVSVSAPSVPVTAAERDSVLSGIDAEIRPLIEAEFPNSKPAFTDLVVTDDGRLWVRRPKSGPVAETVVWWILDPDTKTIHEVQLPPAVDVEVVQDGNAYGTTTTEEGAPAVVRYRIRTVPDANGPAMISFGHTSRIPLVLWSLELLCGVFPGCGRNPSSSNLGDWTQQKEALTLTETHRRVEGTT